MPRQPPSRPALLVSKVRDDLRFTAMLLRSDRLPRSERVRLAMAKYLAIAADRRSVKFLGGRLHYDNRLTPALLPAYIEEIGRVDAVVDLAACASVVDIGANVGQFGATVAWQYPRTRVWSFEPNPQVRALLERNAGQSANWQVVPWGVGPREEVIDLFVVPGKSAQGSVNADNAVAGLLKTDLRRVQVKVKPLNTSLREQLGMPAVVDVLKIDVEGAEADVLAGIAGVEWRYLVIETSRKRAGLGLGQVLDLLTGSDGRAPEVVWVASVGKDAATQDVILRRP